MPKYRVTVEERRMDFRFTEWIVWAASAHKARENYENGYCEQVGDWGEWDEDFSVLDVEELKEDEDDSESGGAAEDEAAEEQDDDTIHETMTG